MLNANKLYCYGFGWDRVKFIHRGLSDAVFCIFGENNGVKKSKFVAVAEQCLHRPKVFFTSHTALPASVRTFIYILINIVDKTLTNLKPVRIV